jgi:trans-aconitate methyltransferase
LVYFSTILSNFFIEQNWNSKTYAENARFVSYLGMPVVEWLAPRAGERILDLGCGDGVLTLKLQEFGCEVLGVDSSADFLASAESLGLNVRPLDGHSLDFKKSKLGIRLASAGGGKVVGGFMS